jgi:hypothetical protein
VVKVVVELTPIPATDAGSRPHHTKVANMPRYLVETYVSRTHAHDARTAGQRVRAAARQVSQAGEPVRYVRTTLLPGDETCFHVFDAVSENAVAEVCRLAWLGTPRIVRAIE